MKENLQASGIEIREAGREIRELEQTKKDLQQIVREQASEIDALRERAYQATSSSPAISQRSATKKLPDISVWEGGDPQEFQS